MFLSEDVRCARVRYSWGVYTKVPHRYDQTGPPKKPPWDETPVSKHRKSLFRALLFHEEMRAGRSEDVFIEAMG